MKTNVNVAEWVSLFEAIGLSESVMHQWHEIFESRHPDGHQGFLEWMELGENDILRIRKSSREQSW